MKQLIQKFISAAFIIIGLAARAECSCLTSGMQMTTPFSPTVITANQVTAPALANISISDTDATVRAPSASIVVCAPEALNVEVWTAPQGSFVSSMAVRLTSGTNGNWTGVLPLNTAYTGPMNIQIHAWNSLPGNNGYTIHYLANADLQVQGGITYVHPMPVGATGMYLQTHLAFDALYAAPCQVGVYPCVVTNKGGNLYYQNLPDHLDYGACANEHREGNYNPFYVTGGALRIRMGFPAGYHDPYGFSRPCYDGALATMFPDGTGNIGNATKFGGYGYYEVSLMSPNAAGGSGGGTWPGWWHLTSNCGGNTPTNVDSSHPPCVNTQTAIELDGVEQYGKYPVYTQSGFHAYGNSCCNVWGFHANTAYDLTQTFHRYGVDFEPGMTTYWIDDVKVASSNTPTFNDGATPVLYMLLELAAGSGYTVAAPPGGYYDMWVRGVWYYNKL